MEHLRLQDEDAGIYPVAGRFRGLGFLNKMRDPVASIEDGYATLARVLAIVKGDRADAAALTVKSYEAGEITVQEVIAIDDEECGREKALQVLDSPRGAEELSLAGVGNRDTEEGTVFEMICDCIRTMVEIDCNRADIVASEELYVVLEDGLAVDSDHWLGEFLGQGPEPRALSGGEQQCPDFRGPNQQAPLPKNMAQGVLRIISKSSHRERLAI